MSRKGWLFSPPSGAVTSFRPAFFFIVVFFSGSFLFFFFFFLTRVGRCGRPPSTERVSVGPSDSSVLSQLPPHGFFFLCGTATVCKCTSTRW